MKKILFICIENSCRSQIGEAFANFLGKDRVIAYSAGSKPSGKVNEAAIEVMEENGIDISSARSKGFSDLPIKDFDSVISMGCKDACPFVPAESHIDWQIPDPKEKGIDFFRKIRDDIEKRVKRLIDDI